MENNSTNELQKLVFMTKSHLGYTRFYFMFTLYISFSLTLLIDFWKFQYILAELSKALNGSVS